MAHIFDGLDLTDIAAHTSEIMQSMMEKIRHHQVSFIPHRELVISVVITFYLILSLLFSNLKVGFDT